MEEYFGVVPCTLMSMASNSLNPSACETDIVGALAMLALSLASGRPSAIVDWNNNYGDDPDKAVVFHCSNLPAEVFVDDIPVMDFQAILSGSVGKENSWGTIVGRVKESPFTYLRISTDDLNGCITAYTGEGIFTNDPVDTFGGYGVVQLPRGLHLRERLRASRVGEPDARRANHRRSAVEVPGLVGVSPRLTAIRGGDAGSRLAGAPAPLIPNVRRGRPS